MSKIDIYLKYMQKICIVLWASSIAYATYHVYIYVLSKESDAYIESGGFEWQMFKKLIFSGEYMLCNGIFIISSKFLDNVAFSKVWQLVSFLQSIFLLFLLTDTLPLIFTIFQPIIFLGIAKTRNPILAWIVWLMFAYTMTYPLKFMKYFIPKQKFQYNFFIITNGWISMKCISFCHDIWKIRHKQKIQLNDLFSYFSYCFYLPLLVYGPVVRYAAFKSHIIDGEKITYSCSKWILLFKKLAMIACLYVLIEKIIKVIPFRVLSQKTNLHAEMNNWTICGIIYWLGQFYCLKYMVLYGLTSAIAEFNGMPMHRLPICVSHVHRHSDLWRHFDYGIYDFMKTYIYVPLVNWMENNNAKRFLSPKVQKFLASFASFVFVFIWHNMTLSVFYWAILNFIGITLEAVGTGLRKQLDKQMNLRNVHWNCIIEPIVTAPLTTMYIINSSIFCGSLEAATSFAQQLWNREGFYLIFVFIFFATQTGVACRSQRYQIRTNYIRQ